MSKACGFGTWTCSKCNLCCRIEVDASRAGSYELVDAIRLLQKPCSPANGKLQKLLVTMPKLRCARSIYVRSIVFQHCDSKARDLVISESWAQHHA